MSDGTITGFTQAILDELVDLANVIDERRPATAIEREVEEARNFIAALTAIVGVQSQAIDQIAAASGVELDLHLGETLTATRGILRRRTARLLDRDGDRHPDQ